MMPSCSHTHKKTCCAHVNHIHTTMLHEALYIVLTQTLE